MSNVQSKWEFRFLNGQDIEEVKLLCQDWFPVRYPEKWYLDITSGERFYSLAAVDRQDGHILGFVVCDVKELGQVKTEDGNMLVSYLCNDDTRMAYILSLGVVKPLRRHRLGSALLGKLLDYLTSPVMGHVKAVYLHVLCTNYSAIKFYEIHNFRQHAYIPYYYNISGQSKDGYSYVLYINSGRPAYSILSLSSLGSVALGLCAAPFAMTNRIFRTLALTASRLR